MMKTLFDVMRMCRKLLCNTEARVDLSKKVRYNEISTDRYFPVYRTVL